MSTYLLSEQHPAIYIATSVTGILSLLGVLSFIYSFFAIKAFRTEIRRLLVILCALDGCMNIVFLVTLWATVQNDIVCKLVTIATTFFPASCILWTMCISWCAYKKIYSELGMWALSNRLDTIFHLISFGYPFITVLCLIVSRDYAEFEEYGCWIPKNPVKNEMFRIVCYFILRWVSLIFNAVMYSFVLRRGRRVVEHIPRMDDNSQQMRDQLIEIDDQLKRLGWVPLSFMILNFWGVINSFLDVFVGDQKYLFLNVTQAIGDQGQGCALAILFVFTHKQFRKYCAYKCRSVWPRETSVPLHNKQQLLRNYLSGSQMSETASWSENKAEITDSSDTTESVHEPMTVGNSAIEPIVTRHTYLGQARDSRESHSEAGSFVHIDPRRY